MMLMLCNCTTVSDKEMQQRFHSRRQTLDELVRMAVTDHLTCVVTGKGAAPCLTPQRALQYQRLLKGTAFGISPFWSEGYLLFPAISTGGLLGSDAHARGYAYSLGLELNPKTDDTAAHELEATQLVFRPITGKWYLYLSP
jgi:bacterioferritin-associated ferredoxin